MNMRICATQNHNGLISKLICVLWTRPSTCKLRQRLSFIADLKSISMNQRSAFSFCAQHNPRYSMQANSTAGNFQEHLIIPFQMLEFDWFCYRKRIFSNRWCTNNNGWSHLFMLSCTRCCYVYIAFGTYMRWVYSSACIEKQLLLAIHFMSFYSVLKFRRNNALSFICQCSSGIWHVDGVFYKMKMGSSNIECFSLNQCAFFGLKQQ